MSLKYLDETKSPMEEADVCFNGINLHSYSYNAPTPKGLVFLSHGLSEWTMKQYKYIDLFSVNGYSVFALDMPNHGKSTKNNAKPTALIDDILGFVESWVKFIEDTYSKHTGLPVFWFGHSAGATVGFFYFLFNNF
jgi:alpha-beta hydrolase superfamily lysophospholipase